MKIIVVMQIILFITGTIWVLREFGRQFSFSDTYNTLEDSGFGIWNGNLFSYWLYAWLLPTLVLSIVLESPLLAGATIIEIIVGIAPARDYGNRTKLIHNIASVLGIVLAVIGVGALMPGYMIIIWPAIVFLVCLGLYLGLSKDHRIFWIEFTCAIAGVYSPLVFLV